MNSDKTSSKNIITRSYEPGDEVQIVNFLNLCYGAWGDLRKWQRLYTEYPSFNKHNVLIMENNGEIVGHRGLHFRNLALPQGGNLPTASLGDTAVHPLYRGMGLYSRLHEATLQAAKSKDVCLALTWNLKGSTTYNHNKKTGFTEIEQAPVYTRIIKPEKVLKAGLFNFIHANEKLRSALQDLGDTVYFGVGKSQFSIGELLGEADKEATSNSQKIEVTFDEGSVPLLASFRNMDKLQRIKCLALLLLLGKVKIGIGSFGIFLRSLGKGVRLLGFL